MSSCHWAFHVDPDVSYARVLGEGSPKRKLPSITAARLAMREALAHKPTTHGSEVIYGLNFRQPRARKIRQPRVSTDPQIFSGGFAGLRAEIFRGKISPLNKAKAKALVKRWAGVPAPVGLREPLKLARRVVFLGSQKHKAMLAEHSLKKSPYWETLSAPVQELSAGVARPTSSRAIKIRSRPVVDGGNILIGPQAPQLEVVRPRLARLALVVKALSAKPLGRALLSAYCLAKVKQYSRADPLYVEKLEETLSAMREGEILPQMDESSHGGDSSLKVEKQGNVSIQHQEETSVTTASVEKPSMLQMCSASEKQTLSRLTQRWLKLKDTLQWTTSETRAVEPWKSIALPKQAILENFDSPNILPFLIHRYGMIKNMRVRLEPTSNRFQIGSLLVSWFFNGQYFSTTFDTESNKNPIMKGRNLYSASQRNHVILDAASSNPVEITIPFWQLWALSNIKNDNTDMRRTQQLSYGFLDVYVLNPLRTAAGVATNVDISVYVAFDDPEFRGIIDRSLDLPTPQMDVVNDLVKTAEDSLHLVSRVSNMDKPPAAQSKIQVQPLASQSLSYMDNDVERLQALRMDPLAQTPAFGESEESSFDSQLRRWSLLDHFDWPVASPSGTRLWSMDSLPLLPLNRYKETTIDNFKAYHLPIIAILSSMRGYFSGDIELRFDFVCSMFNTGALQISTVPGVVDSISLDRAKNSYSQVFKLKDVRQLVYRVPYYANMPAWPVRERDGYHPGAPSRTFVYVLNKLTSTNQLPSEIFVNVYIRAAENFSLTLPMPTHLGLPWNRVLLPAAQNAYVKVSWAQIFTSGSRWAKMPSGKEALCCFYDETTDDFTQFDNFDGNYYYKVPLTYKSGGAEHAFRIQYYKEGGSSLGNVSYLCQLKAYGNYPVAICFTSAQNAEAYAKTGSLTTAIPEAKQGPWAQWKENNTGEWKDIPNSELVKVPFARVSISSDWEFLPQMEESSTVAPTISMEQPATSTSAGKSIFGESVSDIKSFGRRWVHYGCLADVKPKSGACLGNCVPLAKIAVHPIRLLDVNNYRHRSSKSRDNRVREGALGVLLSAFAGYRGGIRFKIVVSSSPDKTDACFLVSHRYDEAIDMTRGVIQEISDSNISSSTFLDTTYASSFQSLDVNTVLDVEVPFYKPGPWAQTYPPCSGDAFVKHLYHGNGNLYLYVNKIANGVSFDIDVFYSLADDFAVSCWQGYGPMMALTDIHPEPQMDILSNIIKLPSKLSKTCDTIKDVLQDCSTSIIPDLKSISQSIRNMSFAEGFNKLANACTGFGALVFSQILHIVSSPTARTIAVALLSLFGSVSASTLTFMYLTNFIRCITSLMNAWGTEFLPNGGDEQQQPSDQLTTALSLMWSLCAGIAKVKVAGPAPLSLLSGLFRYSTDIFRSHVFGVRFFKDCLTLAKSIFQTFNRDIGSLSSFYNIVKDDSQLLRWFAVVDLLTTPSSATKLEQLQEWQEQLFAAHAFGGLLYLQSTKPNSKLSPALSTAIRNQYKKISTLVQEIIDRRAFCPIRCKPFCLWINGKSGLGKTEFLLEFIRTHAKELGVPPDVYELSAGVKYYDLLTHQKVILLDDLLNVKGGEYEQDTLSQFQKLIGTAPISLPRSAVDDKKRSDNPTIVAITSNQKNFDDVNDIRCKVAFERRVDMWIEFLPTEQHYNPRTANKIAFNKSSRKFRFHYGNASAKVEVTTDEELCAHILSRYKQVMEKNWQAYKIATEQHLASVQQCIGEATDFDTLVSAMIEAVSNPSHDNGSYIRACVERLKKLFAPPTTPSPTEPVQEGEDFEAQGPEDGASTSGCFLGPKEDGLPQHLEDFLDEICGKSDEYRRQKFESAFRKAQENSDQRSSTVEFIPEDVYDHARSFEFDMPYPFSSCSTTDWMRKLPALVMDKNCPHQVLEGQDIRNIIFIPYRQEFISLILSAFPLLNLEGAFILMGDDGVCSAAVDSQYCCFERTHHREVPEWRTCALKKLSPKLASICYERAVDDLGFVRYVSSTEPREIDLATYSIFEKSMPYWLFSSHVLKPAQYLAEVLQYKIDARRMYGYTRLIQEGFVKERCYVDGICHVLTLDEVENAWVNGSLEKSWWLPGARVERRQYRMTESPDSTYSKYNLRLQPWARTLVWIGGIIAFFCTMIKLVSFVCNALQAYGLLKNIVPNISVSGDNVTNKPASSASIRAAKLLSSGGNGVVEDAASKAVDTNSTGILNQVARNILFLVASRDEGNGNIATKRARCFGVKGTTVIILDHYLEVFNGIYAEDKTWQFFIISPRSVAPFPIELKQLFITKAGGTGYSVFDLPSNYPVKFKDLTKKMSREGPVSCPKFMTLLTVDTIDAVSGHPVFSTRQVTSRIVENSITVKDSGLMGGWSVSTHYEYDVAGVGMCGSILLDLGDQVSPIRAIHTAGISNWKGIGEPLATQTFSECSNSLEFVTPNMNLDPKEWQPEGASIVGHVEPSMRVVTPKVSKIVPSLLHGLLETRTEPAPLSGSDERIKDLGIKPLVEGVNHRLKPVKDFPRWAVEEAVEDYTNLVLTSALPVRSDPGKLTLEQAVLGVDAPYMDKMELRTSEGYPWVKMRPAGFKNKSWMFDIQDGKLQGVEPLLRSTLDCKEKMRAQGLIPPSYYTACLKDARIPKEKIRKPGATRLFEMSAVDLTIAQRSYHLDFYASFLQHRGNLEHTIGINVNGSEWSHLASELLSTSEKILAGDYSKFGPRLNQEILFHALQIIKAWCKKFWPEFNASDDISFDALNEEIVHGLFIVDRTVLRLWAGMMSGNPGTVILNTMGNSLYVRIVFLLIMSKRCPKYASMCYFRKFVKMFSNGDDLLMAVHDDIIAHFNNVSLSETFALFDIKYTNSKKNIEIVPYETIFEVTYLKNEFSQHPSRPGAWLAALSSDSIEDCFQWVWDSRVSLEERTLENCDQAIRLAYGHGPQYFDWLKRTISDALGRLNLYRAFPTWKFLDSQVWDEGIEILNFHIQN